MTRVSFSGNKYHARKTYSELCGRTFDSKAEAKRGEELCLLEKAGEISGLEYQPKFTLCDKPKITYKADFKYVVRHEYQDTGFPVKVIVIEDVKGVLTREARVKIAWLKEKFGIEIKLIR